MNNFKESLKTKVTDDTKETDLRQEVKNRLFDVLGEELEEIRKSNIDPKSRCIQEDMVLDLMHFLMDYEKNVKILNKHIQEEKFDGR